jgi:hypothetical protein
MTIKFNRYLVISLFGLALLAGCAAQRDSTSALRASNQVNTDPKSESTRSKGSDQTEPPNITYRPGA